MVLHPEDTNPDEYVKRESVRFEMHVRMRWRSEFRVSFGMRRFLSLTSGSADVYYGVIPDLRFWRLHAKDGRATGDIGRSAFAFSGR